MYKNQPTTSTNHDEISTENPTKKSKFESNKVTCKNCKKKILSREKENIGNS